MVNPIVIVISIINFTGIFVACKSSLPVYENTDILNYENVITKKTIPESLIDKSPTVDSIQEINLSDTANLASYNKLTPIEENFVYEFDIINGWREELKSDTIITKDKGLVIINETRDNWIKDIKNSSKMKLLATLEHNGIKLLLIMLEQKFSIYNHSSRIYAFGIIDNEVKSIVQVSEFSINEDSHIKSSTIFNDRSIIYNEVYRNAPEVSIKYKYSKSGYIVEL